jgi:hypothetical protein
MSAESLVCIPCIFARFDVCNIGDAKLGCSGGGTRVIHEAARSFLNRLFFLFRVWDV